MMKSPTVFTASDVAYLRACGDRLQASNEVIYCNAELATAVDNVRKALAAIEEADAVVLKLAAAEEQMENQ